MFIDRDLSYPPSVPSLQSLYDMAQKQGLFPGVPLEIFDKAPHMLLWAAVDTESYQRCAHLMLERAGVPKDLRRFDHSFILKMVKELFEPPKPK